MDTITVWIFVMAALTFGCRYFFFSRIFPIALNDTAKHLLTYTAPCVLTALWTPLVFQDAIHSFDILNPYLLAGIFTVLVSIFIRHTLLVIALGMMMFYALRWILQ